MSSVRILPRAAPFFLGKKAVLGVVELFVVPLPFYTSYLVAFTYIPVCDLYRFLCILYMIDRRPVIISALIHSLFVDTLQIISVLVVFFIIEQWFVFIAFLLSLVPSTHLHHADAHFTLLINAHPAISTHSLPSFIVIFSIMFAVGNCNVPICKSFLIHGATLLC